MWQGPTLLGLGRRKYMEDLNPCAPNATTITMGSVLPSATTARRLAIWPVTAKKDCPKMKNNNCGNPAGNSGATIRAYTVGIAKKSPDSNVVTEIGSFNVIISMDWLSMYHVVIVCDEKIIRIPFANEILIVCGDGSNNRHESQLKIISCTKTQKYLLKAYDIFLVHVTTKKAEDKSKKKHLKTY
ncbi:hypothetical protein Tco_0018836 [Tanacetum coccineum]